MKKKTEKNLKTVYIPKEYKGDDALFVSVNGKRILVKKGEAVEVPIMYAEVIENSIASQKKADDFISSCSANM